MFLSFHTVISEEKSVLLVHMVSTIPDDFGRWIQDHIDDRTDPGSPDYDPGFGWDADEIVVLYHGLREMPETWEIPMPDGRNMKAYNINPGMENKMARAMRTYTETQEVGRRALLRGRTPMDAACMVMGRCFVDGWEMPEEEEDFFKKILVDMTQMQEAMEEDIALYGAL